jgi:hypothetical protein
MKRLFLIATALFLFATTSSPLSAAERQSTIRPLQERRPVSGVLNVAESQFSSQPIQGTGPVSRALELNRQKNVFIMRTVFGR